MSYREALEATGAKVWAFQEFGSYQGEWLALVEYKNIFGWIKGSYGSCSGCDAFEAEFGYGTNGDPDYKERLIRFGEEYIKQMVSQGEIEEDLKKDIHWDHEKEYMLKFVQENFSFILVMQDAIQGGENGK